MWNRVLILSIVIALGISVGRQIEGLNGGGAQPTASRLPSPCIIDGSPDVYLMIDKSRRHIVNWDTFLALGYRQSDIVPCGAAANDPLGGPITRLFKGSDASVYWMEAGQRRHIPDMQTFSAMGYTISDITVLPDSILTLWPEGAPLPSSAQTQAATAQPTAAKSGAVSVCGTDLDHAYLVAGDIRYPIYGWVNTLNLGFTEADLHPCDANLHDTLTAAIRSSLIKGSADAVYWMQNGVRHHIPDMATFDKLGFNGLDITVLPDWIVSWWPLGDDLTSAPPPASDHVRQTLTIGAYTIRLWYTAHRLEGYATISAPGRADVRVNAAESIGQLPAADVTGEGHPDVMFLLRSVYSGHCCWGTSVYDLGPKPVEVLAITSPAYNSPDAGRGVFRDLNGDGSYEFITEDQVQGGCSVPNVETVLAYRHGRYVGASPSFLSYYTRYLDQAAALTNHSPETREGYECIIQPLVPTLLYIGKVKEARLAFDHLYAGPDAETLWNGFVQGVKKARFYVPA